MITNRPERTTMWSHQPDCYERTRTWCVNSCRACVLDDSRTFTYNEMKRDGTGRLVCRLKDVADCVQYVSEEVFFVVTTERTMSVDCYNTMGMIGAVDVGGSGGDDEPWQGLVTASSQMGSYTVNTPCILYTENSGEICSMVIYFSYHINDEVNHRRDFGVCSWAT
jgi:hypothetical protein